MKAPALARLLAVLASSALAVAVGASTGAKGVVERIRYIGTASYGRVVVDLSQPVQFHVQQVPEEGKRGAPDRLVIDVDDARIGPEAKRELTIGDSLLRGIRTGQYTRATARIVLDLASEASARTFTLPDPYRLVIDLRGKPGAPGPLASSIRRLDTARAGEPSPAAPRALARRVEPSAAPRPLPSRPPSKTAERVENEGVSPQAPAAKEQLFKEQRFKVVIDPGHGGKDPGARGYRGLPEKDLVLAVSKLLARRLGAEPGIEVAMTRSDDRYLSLEDRTAFANAQGADLFVSVHGNASTNTGLRGVEVYYLNNTNNRGTLRLAAMENNLRWDPRNPKLQAAIPDLSYILSDLRQTYKVEESKQLAEQLQRSVVSRLQEGYTSVEDLGVKEGPFYVLVGAYMPCVLVEVSFLTNPIEGRRLATSGYRQALADGIYEGIHRYLSQTRLAKTL
jgi:N-acetylmuramoyl-L-alanine amidase